MSKSVRTWICIILYIVSLRQFYIMVKTNMIKINMTTRIMYCVNFIYVIIVYPHVFKRFIYVNLIKVTHGTIALDVGTYMSYIMCQYDMLTNLNITLAAAVKDQYSVSAHGWSCRSPTHWPPVTSLVIWLAVCRGLSCGHFTHSWKSLLL